jgi:hypothetical protein
MAKQTLRFKTKIDGREAGAVSAIILPVDVPEIFGTRARVPVRGTINGFPFRSSLMPMGGCHMMPVNKTLRDGARVKPGDTVECDGAERCGAYGGGSDGIEERIGKEQSGQGELGEAGFYS